MAFADKREYAYWLDQSGNNNDWTSNNLTESDISVDSPTNNFCTHNPLDTGITTGAGSFSEGNLKTTYASGNWFGGMGTMGVSSGKWYFEVYIGANASAMVGVSIDGEHAEHSADIYRYRGNAKKYNTSPETSYGATYGAGDIIGVALDLDADTLVFYKNNVSQGTAFSSMQSGTYLPIVIMEGSNWTVSNFGQDSSFAGNKTAQGNQDGNDIGDFYYTPPTDFLALCTSNLPATITPSEHFSVKTYSGNASDSSTTQEITTDIQPDFVWMKCRSDATSNRLQDIVRGVNSSLYSDTDGAETDQTGSDITTFGTTSFTLTGNGAGTNRSGRTYVAWNWKAGGGTILGTGDFTQGTIASTCSRNVDAGFSIVSYTGQSGAGTVGHGLSKAPELVIAKNRDTASNDWTVGANVIHSAWEEKLLLSDSAAQNATNDWGDTAPTATVYYVGSGSPRSNGDGDSMIAYCWHSVDGFSKVGSYVSNGALDGTFIYTGFRPAYVLVRRTDGSADWLQWDNARDTYNPALLWLEPNTTDAETAQSSAPYELKMDFVSNGFKLRGQGGGLNSSSGATYIYIAFAETPFKYSNAR